MRAPTNLELPPYAWEELKEREDPAEWRAQWRHYETLLLSRGYRLQWPESTPLEEQTKPRTDLPAPKDAYNPQSHENFVASPIEALAKVTVNFNHPLVRNAVDRMGRFALIKAVPTDSNECTVLRFLRDHRAQHAADPSNHTIPIFDMIEIGNVTFAVMAQWSPSFPTFFTLGEYIDCFHQCLEGLAFMHSHLIAHGDIHDGNIMLNYGGGYPILNPGQPFRSLFRPCYAYIDFGQSVQLPSGSDISQCTVTSDLAGIHTPEHSPTVPHNPFYADIYQFGVVFWDVLDNNARTTTIGELAEEHAPDIYELLDAMMVEIPEERLPAADALQWILEIRDKTQKDVLERPISALPPRRREKADFIVRDSEDDSHNFEPEIFHDGIAQGNAGDPDNFKLAGVPRSTLHNETAISSGP